MTFPAQSFLFTAQDGEHERHLTVPEGPVNPVVLIIGMAYQHMLVEGLKVGYLFGADESRWFVRLETP